jgi:hypothetical protein
MIVGKRRRVSHESIEDYLADVENNVNKISNSESTADLATSSEHDPSVGTTPVSIPPLFHSFPRKHHPRSKN